MKEKIPRNRKTPANTMDRCFECGSSQLIRELGEVICLHCGWNSVEAHVWSMPLNQMFQEPFPNQPRTGGPPF